jgi:hypothetical protein
MENILQRFLKRIVLAALGLVVTLAWWSITGDGSDEVKGIPATVWEGDGGTLSVEVETATPARFSMSFSDEADRTMHAWTNVNAGKNQWTVKIPRGAGGYIELGAEEPKVGDRLQWKIYLNGELVDEQSETLEQPLQSGYAFFLQSYYDDYSKIEVEKEEDDESDTGEPGPVSGGL